MIPLKQCGQCLKFKTHTEFILSPTGKDGLNSICKRCQADNARLRYHGKKKDRKPPIKFKSKWYMPL